MWNFSRIEPLSAARSCADRVSLIAYRDPRSDDTRYAIGDMRTAKPCSGDRRYAIRDMRGRGILIAAALLAACATPMKQYALDDLRLSCDDANRTTYKALTAMGFTISAFTPAAMGRPGEAKAVRERRGPDSGTDRVTVTIACTPTGAHVDASEDGKLLGQVEFRRAFFLSFTSTQYMDERRREMEEKIAAGTAPASQQRQGLQVLVEPVRGQAAKLDFELDLAAAAVLPVRVRVINNTARQYRIAPMEIQLMRRDRTRVEPLPVTEVAARVLNATDANGQPLTTLSNEALSQRLDTMRFTMTRIQPRGEAGGYLYFPLADYGRARVIVTDVETEETEGFAVEF
jgi:hypothetical protein